jgi:uncharacterized protein (TIGR02246 family)
MLRSCATVLFIGAFFGLGSAAGCSSKTAQQPPPVPDTRKTDEAAIRSASADWSRAAEAKDIDKAVSYYTDDAVVFVDKGELLKGKDSIRTSWRQLLAPSAPRLTFSTTFVEIARSGDLAYEYGTYNLATAGKKGKTNDEKGKYVVVWKKQSNGSWKAAVDIDNTGL